MIASLPMYDRPANAAAHHRLWVLILLDDLCDAGDADIACIDAQTWWMQKQDMPETKQVRGIIKLPAVDCDLSLPSLPAAFDA